METWKTLSRVNVNDKTEKKGNLTYLSWAWAWSQVMESYPDATYELIRFEGLPYLESDLGFMVFTKVTIGRVTREMWLPLMDNKNRPIKKQAYKVKTKYGEETVNAATMFDVNTAVMRCLTKNLAMFGLGIYIYAGEDLPLENEEAHELHEIQELSEVDLQKRIALSAALQERANQGVESLKDAWLRMSLEDQTLLGNEIKTSLYNIAKAVDNGQ